VSSRVRIAGLLAMLLPAAAACGIQSTGITALGPAPAALSASAASSPVNSAAEGTQYLLFFYQDSRLTPAYRVSTNGPPSEGTVLDALVQGPSKVEQAGGYTSAVPSNLVAKAQADGLAGAYALNVPLSLRAKAQFICTMQYYDQTPSVGIQILDSNVNWNACKDTTNQYIPMPGDQSTAAVKTIPSPSGG
jgi:hypothetical protein